MSPLERFVDGADDTRDDEPDVDAPDGDGAVVDRPDVLRRFLGPRPRPVAGEACELCATPIGDDHRHIVDLDTQRLRCSCRGCALLFDGDTSSGRYRAVPDRHARIEPFRLEATTWTALQIPVGMAFFMYSTPMAATVAFYPSPGGATESELALDAWDEIVAANPPLADVAPDVEAVLIRASSRPEAVGLVGAGGRSIVDEPRCFIVPVDRCYELVGRLRLHWHGFDGGSEVRARVEDFFDDVAARSKVMGNAHG